ncbi:hypothetical protein ACH35V_27215 [Actinomadura sp. 1N219]|uniref:hypothetical protein n=1 Tax=Actinomadura sp. 1N219 TaxID=3375152 RepID=UPI0037B30FB2
MAGTARLPRALPDDGVERGVQAGRVHGLPERLLGVVAEPDDRSRPGRRIVRVAAGVAPEDVAAARREPWRERLVDADEAVLDEGAGVDGWHRPNLAGGPGATPANIRRGG